ncbi:MAG: trans-sulfuration enzyme family protein [Phycisphaerales bacterium JB043]
MADSSTHRIGTKVIHAGQRSEETTGAVMPPIFTATTYAQASPGVHKGMDYIRAANPTRSALCRMIAQLEGSGLSESDDVTCGGFAFASGMASITTTLDLIDAGSHVVAMDDVYGGTNRLLNRIRVRSQGLDVSHVDMTDLDALASALRPDTRLVWVETPTNPTLKIVDLRGVAELVRARSPQALLGCDNTFASPVNQRPLEHGFDIVMHSATKYLGGHSDVLGGLLVVRDAALAERIRFIELSEGMVMSPFDSYLVLRGIKTLNVRMRQHNESAMRIARHLEAHDRFERVVYPGLDSHPQHEVAKRQMDGFGGMITAFLRGGLEDARRFLERVEIFALAESLGGVESLIEHPAIMTHASVPPEQREALGISDTLIRFSIGVEDTDDLIEDIERALG